MMNTNRAFVRNRTDQRRLFFTRGDTALLYDTTHGCLQTVTAPREKHVSNMGDRNSAPGTTGRLLHWAARYDLMAWLFMFGREAAFREKLVGIARLQPG